MRFWTTISQEPGQYEGYDSVLHGRGDAQGGADPTQPFGSLPPSLQRLEKGEDF